MAQLLPAPTISSKDFENLIGAEIIVNELNNPIRIDCLLYGELNWSELRRDLIS